MTKDLILLQYSSLLPQFQMIEKPMPLAKFAEIEAVLYLFKKNAPVSDPEKAYLLFTQYQMIGATSYSSMDHVLQTVRSSLGRYRSQKLWHDALKEYRDKKYDALRAFQIEMEENGLRLNFVNDSYPLPFEERKKEWEAFWTERVKETKDPAYADDGIYKYNYLNMESGESECVQVIIKKKSFNADPVISKEKGQRSPITVTLHDLLKAAELMETIQPGDPCAKILKTNILKENKCGRVQITDRLDIHEVINIIGMVGSGKTTLIKVLSFWCSRQGYKVTVVLDTVAEVLNLQKYLSSFGITVSPLIGKSERIKYINQVVEPENYCLSEQYSKYLTPNCLIDGMDENHTEAIAFGKEPCYGLKKEKYYLCPYFDQCSGTIMQRECYNASVVITTVAGFAASRVGHNREIFLEVIMRDFDLVIFDECDRVQKTLDQFFMPATSFNEYIGECADECKAFMQLSNKSREENLAMQKYDEMKRQSVTVLSCLSKSLKYDLGSWQKISQGEPFSALTLLEDLFSVKSEYQISKEIYEKLYMLIDSSNEEQIQGSKLWIVLNTSCLSTDEILFNCHYEEWLMEVKDQFNRPALEKNIKIQDARIKLIIRLIYFDHFVRNLNDAYEACHETSYGKNELLGFLRTRFRQQQYLLPSALCGNLFGLKKTDEEDIVLFRQFAFGRSLMKDLSYLRTDEKGAPAGPHVILLSGSSWAQGSYEYHVNRPVNYILEAEQTKRSFLEQTRFYESGFPERVSGAPEEKRLIHLKEITKKTVPLIVNEISRNAGKILLVVNSYQQAEVVQHVLEEALQREKCHAGVCRMVSDSTGIQSKQNTIRRGEVSRFAYSGEAVLIAPAMAIERGHNIIDEKGHSALCAVFFMVRPMSVPDDIQQKGCKLNGYVESECKRTEGESTFAFNMRIRQVATKEWVRLSKIKPFGISELDCREQKDIVATLFILILQIFGRLARVTDVSRPEPHVYFIDGAFRERSEKQDDFDCLTELGKYLEELMTNENYAEIALTLYEPFYKAFRKDIRYV